MRTVVIKSKPGFDEWRDEARWCLQDGVPPDQVRWQDTDIAQDLFGDANVVARPLDHVAVSKEFVELARVAACHSADDRFGLLYRVLWRLCHENKNLLRHRTDDDILKLNAYVKAVRRDAYKIKAFLRFREAEGQHFIAWYEPFHYSLELSLPFFQTRFKNMTWSILTPYLAAHWDKKELKLVNNPDPSFAPKEDEVEKYWLKYYASTFNPARPKKGAMLNQMPKKYWKNMPETVLINDMLRTSEARARKMIDEGQA